MADDEQSRRTRQVWRQMRVSDPVGSPLEGWFPEHPSNAQRDQKVSVAGIPSSTRVGTPTITGTLTVVMPSIRVSAVGTVTNPQLQLPRPYRWLLKQEWLVGGSRTAMFWDMAETHRRKAEGLRDANTSKWKLFMVQARNTIHAGFWVLLGRVKDIVFWKRIFDILS